MSQDDINTLLVCHAARGAHVVRLKGDGANIFERLDEEIDALDRRRRNPDLRLVTTHDMHGFAKADWRALAAPGAVTARSMGKRAARFVQGRLLMHGASPAMNAAIVANASCRNEHRLHTRLSNLRQAAAGLRGPAIILPGLAPLGKTQTEPQTELAQ